MQPQTFQLPDGSTLIHDGATRLHHNSAPPRWRNADAPARRISFPGDFRIWRNYIIIDTSDGLFVRTGSLCLWRGEEVQPV